MNVLSLFTGIGGIDLGLEQAGHTIIGQCEIDEYRRAVLAHRFPGIPCAEDVREVDPTTRSARDGGRRTRGIRPGTPGHGAFVGGESADLICGGFPCQDLSVAGQRKGLAGERSGLFFQFARIINTVRPRWVLVENVPGLLSSNGGRDFGIVLGTLADIGYSVAWRILDSRHFGVPQRRRRVYLLATLAELDPRGERCAQVLAVGARCQGHPPQGTTPGQDAAVASLSGLGTGGPDDNDGQGGRLLAYSLNAKQGVRYDREETYIASPLSHGSNPNSNMAGRRREDDFNLVTAFHMTQDPISGDVAPAMSKGTPSGAATIGVVTFTSRGRGGEPQTETQTDGLHPALRSRKGGGARDSGIASPTQGVRRLTPRECERLQGFPDDWTLVPFNGNPAPDSRRYAAIGDAVTVNVAEWIGSRLP